jgi:hypothetical protein
MRAPSFYETLVIMLPLVARPSTAILLMFPCSNVGNEEVDG